MYAFREGRRNRILAAVPVGNPNLTNQRAFYVVISRARDHAELVTDQLEVATGERVAALDGVAKEAAHETEFGIEPSQGPGHLDRVDLGHEPEFQAVLEHEPEHLPWHEIDGDHDLESTEPSAGRDGDSLESRKLDRGNRSRGRPLAQAGTRLRLGRDTRSGRKSIDLDLEL